MSQKLIEQKIEITPQMYEIVQLRTKQVGFRDTSEYLRSLVAEDIKLLFDSETLDAQTEKLILSSIGDYNSAKTITLKNAADIDQFFNSLFNL